MSRSRGRAAASAAPRLQALPLSCHSSPSVPCGTALGAGQAGNAAQPSLGHSRLQVLDKSTLWENGISAF